MRANHKVWLALFCVLLWTRVQPAAAAAGQQGSDHYMAVPVQGSVVADEAEGQAAPADPEDETVYVAELSRETHITGELDQSKAGAKTGDWTGYTIYIVLLLAGAVTVCLLKPEKRLTADFR